MREYAYDFNRPIPGGQVVFEVFNVGSEDHEIDVSVLPEDFPPLLEQLRSEEQVATRTLARFPSHPPGSRGTFALYLLPGRYAMTCFLPAPDGSFHGQKGMAVEIRIA